MSYGFVLREQYKGRYIPEETRHFCKICNCWMSKAPSQIRKHEQGAQHQMKKKQMFYNMRKEKNDKERKEKELSKELAAIEAAAQSAYSKDLASGVAGARTLHDEATVRKVGGVNSGYTTSVGVDGRKEAYREYKPPQEDDEQPVTAEDASKNLIAFYNKKYGHVDETDLSREQVRPYKVGTNGWGRYSEDKKYYRAVIIKVKTNKETSEYEDKNNYTVRYTDYGNEEDLHREDFTTEVASLRFAIYLIQGSCCANQEPALWMKPPENAKNTSDHALLPEKEQEVSNTHEAEPSEWATVSAGQGVWASNEKKLKQRNKKRKLMKVSISDKYSGGDAFTGYSNSYKEIEADDYGLNEENRYMEAEEARGVPESLETGAAKVGFKKRGKKRRNRNVRAPTSAT